MPLITINQLAAGAAATTDEIEAQTAAAGASKKLTLAQLIQLFLTETVSATPINLSASANFTDAGGGIIALPAYVAGRSFTITCTTPPTGWTGAVTWAAATPPAPTVAKKCVFEFMADPLGTTWLGMLSVDNL